MCELILIFCIIYKSLFNKIGNVLTYLMCLKIDKLIINLLYKLEIHYFKF